MPRLGQRYFLNCFKISRAAFAPEPPVKPAPGCVPLPHKVHSQNLRHAFLEEHWCVIPRARVFTSGPRDLLIPGASGAGDPSLRLEKTASLGMTPTWAPGYFFNSFAISLAAFAPEPPVNPAPGCVPLPHKYRFSIGVR